MRENEEDAPAPSPFFLGERFWAKQDKEGERTEDKALRCPECGSEEYSKGGMLRTKNGEVQRYYCRVCARRFS